jgi:biopolymer transport protein TolR
MGMNIANNDNKSGRRGRKRMSEINVTPLVDVMLVLLVVFMITAPMLVVGVDVDLPETKASAISSQEQPLVISITKDGKVFLVETEIDRKDLVEKLKNITKEKKETRIFVKGDKNVHYGTVVEVMTEIISAGFSKVALISDTKQK